MQDSQERGEIPRAGQSGMWKEIHGREGDEWLPGLVGQPRNTDVDRVTELFALKPGLSTCFLRFRDHSNISFVCF